MFLLKGLTTHYLLGIINLIPIGDLRIFVIQYGVEWTFMFSGIDIEKCCFISLAVALIKMLLL